NQAARARLQQPGTYQVELKNGFADQTGATEQLKIVGNPLLQVGNREVVLHVARPSRISFPPPQGTLSIRVTTNPYATVLRVPVISRSQATARLNIAYSHVPSGG